MIKVASNTVEELFHLVLCFFVWLVSTRIGHIILGVTFLASGIALLLLQVPLQGAASALPIVLIFCGLALFTIDEIIEQV